MSRRRLLGLAAVVAALAGAVVLTLLGLDALRWRGHLDEADQQFARAPGGSSLWEPDLRLPAGLTRRLLGVEDDLRYRRALQSFRLSRPTLPPRELADVARRSRAETELARTGRREQDAARRSQLATLRGALTFEEARGDEGQAAVFLRRSITDFREAIRLDPRNEDARYDLELVLRLLRNVESESGGGGGGERGDTPASGAGAASEGGGY
ncbi:MAG: hypothetical protein H0V40_06185 [Actinobacteria bacterium]|nr:hypothetical protein [Actinomycetota bacterium]